MSGYRGDRGGRGARGRGGGDRGGRGSARGFGGGGGNRGFGGGRGGGQVGGGGPPIVGQVGSLDTAAQRVLPTAADHITTIGVKRPAYGTAGRVIKVMVNAFETSIPQTIIRHYDVMTPSEQTLPMALTMALIRQLQQQNPSVFTQPAVYDGRKNMFAAFELNLGPNSTNQFDVSLPVPGGATRVPKVYKIKLTKVAEINAEVLERFVRGDQSHDNAVLTAITALNVVIRMDPFSRYTFNVRSFFTSAGSQPIGLGLELWPGLFQSVRPGIGRMLINVDTSTALMYRSGPLTNLCLEFLRKPIDQPSTFLTRASNMPDRIRLSLSRFLSNVKVRVTPTIAGEVGPVRIIKKLSSAGANELTFTLRDGASMTVADYFKTTRNRPLRFPNLFCIEVASGALIPLELCEVVPGQIVRKQVPPEKTSDVVKFATKRPRERLARIVDGVQNTLAYGQSDYVREFGMNVNTAGPLLVEARVLRTPVLKYGKGSTVVPKNGAWNMVERKFFRPIRITQWCVAVYEREDRFNKATVDNLIKGVITACETAGMIVDNKKPLSRYLNGQGNVVNDLSLFGNEVWTKTKIGPRLFIVVLPETGNDIYTSVKHFGDCVKGVATQCVKSIKSTNASSQYWANVALKLNVKLGGINVIPEPNSLTGFSDPKKPTIIMGADVIHPAPGSEGRPSYTALVGNIDSDMAKYIATSRAQTSGQEMIDDEDFKEMAKTIIKEFREHLSKVERRSSDKPERIIFYRDGVSEGQFKQVLDQELPSLRNACKELGISPKITVIIVGKRHHMRFFPQDPSDEDKSGNCPAGTVVDTVVAHPTEFDFYLQSHGGLLGTSRSSHYSVLYDDNKFSPDAIQALSFALCHVYARSTRSVSIPAPVYYADIVCSRARNHYDPSNEALMSSESQTHKSLDEGRLQAYRSEFKKVHNNLSKTMYFS